MERYSYDLLLNFLEGNNLISKLKFIDQYLEISTQSDPKPEES